MGSFARIANGREDWGAGACVPRHRHNQAYAAVVLSGSYEECGSRGRFRVGPGDVLLHDAFDAHLDRFQSKGAQVLNLIIDAPGFSMGQVDDPDTIACASDAVEAGARLRAQLRPAKRVANDWPDMLADGLLRNPDCRLDLWARKHGLAPETISRGFGKLFGITPASFRAEARARRAFWLLAGSEMPLVSIAAVAGFADQAHMSRAIRALTGASPGAWRRSNSFKTERALAA